MTSLDHRLNPLFSIKECMTCGALYTADFCCSKGGLEDKILVPKPPQNCATCGNPVDGLYCRSCAFVRRCLNEGWYTIHDENEILNTSESSNHNTNVVSTPQEPFVFNQDPGVNSSQSPLQSNHNCCFECGDSLDGIFCQQCTCKSCGNGAHIGYNCPPKAPIISNPEQCNQTINELPQTLPSVHPTCNYEDENSFTYDSKPNSFNDSPSVLTHPPQLQFETYLCELCGNNAHYGYDCPPQFPLVYEQEPCYNQNFNDNYFPQNSQSSSQQYLCCENCGGPHETFQCQPMNEDYYEQNSCYYPNSLKAVEQSCVTYGGQVYQPPTSQQPVYQAQPYQAPAQQMQGVSNTNFENYVKANDAVLINMQNQGQVTNPKEDLKGITTRSGIAYQGPTIPTSSPKVVERRTEVTKDTIFPTNNGISKDVQPSVVPVENQNPVSEPDGAPLITPMPNPKLLIPYPSRRNDERHRENANEQKDKFYEIFKDMSFEISFMDALTLMPKFASTLKALIGNKEKLSEMARTPLNEHCSAVILNKLPYSM
ncbi:hypothetical protein Tco_0211035 [Tanacetum coccineum]